MAQVRTLQLSESLDSLWEELVYTEARLLGDPLTKDLAPAYGALLERLESVRGAQRKSWRDEISAQAAVDAANTALDAATVSFGAKLLAAMNGDRQSPRWKRYFPDTVSAVTRLALGKQVERVRSWPASLAGEAEPELKGFAPRFEQLLADGDAALRARVESAARRADQRVREVATLVDDANAARLTTMGRLLQRGVKNALPKDWAEGFFRRTSRRVKATEEPEAEGGEAEG